MKRLKILNYIAIVSLVLLFSSYREPEKNQATIQFMMGALNQLHFKPQNIDDTLSGKVFDLYIKRLDFSKKFFLKSDVDALNKYRHDVDDQINRGSFEFFEEADRIIQERTNEAEAYYKDILSKPFEFTANESVETEPKKLAFSKDKNALKDAWRKSLKEQVLSRLSSQMDIQEKAKEKKDTSVKILTFEKMEADARKKVLKSHDDWFKRLKQVDKNERFAAYINAIANTYDPHTEFFPPKEKDEFDAQMSGQFEGIGASLQEKDGQIKVAEIIPGSASYRQGQLKAGDLIMKVAQAADEPVDIADMRLDKVVQLIRGKKGTEVRLTVKKPDASIVVITIIRDKVVIEQTFAQSFIVKDKKRIGYIHLPLFYADFNRNGGRACADDIRKEVLKLEAEKVDGIVIDLRNNGGGSLEEVVRMAGLFIDKGPIVQVKAREGSPKVLDDRESGIVYDGPLAIMVNSNSASASEILAAAMQDYKRAIIVGGKSSFGKGTVQQFINLDDAVSADNSNLKPLGSVKLTIQKFYRVSGGSTQLKGVIPDLILPDPYSEIEMGEKDQDYPMPYDEIAPAKYNALANIDYAKITDLSKKRTEHSPYFNLITEQSKRYRAQKDKTTVSLNLETFRAEQKKSKEEGKKFEGMNKEIPGFDVTNLEVDMKNESDTSHLARKRETIKGLKKDNYIFETVKALEDMK